MVSFSIYLFSNKKIDAHISTQKLNYVHFLIMKHNYISKKIPKALLLRSFLNSLPKLLLVDEVISGAPIGETLTQKYRTRDPNL